MVRVERALASDIPELIELLRTLFSLERDFAFDAGRQRRGLTRLLAEPRDRASVLVARDDGAIAGMVSGQLVISTAEGAPSVWIEDMVVAPAFRGRGIGRALLRGVTDWAVAQGASRAQLLADSDNTSALAFYRHLGLEPTNLVALRLSKLGRQSVPPKKNGRPQAPVKR